MSRTPARVLRRFRSTAGLAGALILFGAAYAAPALPAGSLYDDAFHWTDDKGQRVELSSFEGRPVILTMFYTGCAETCPVTLSKLHEIETAFDERKIAAEFVLVSYDSSFDTPHALRLYREREKLGSSRWHLLAGPPGSVRRFANRIGLGNYRNGGDHIIHSFRILLLDERGVAQKALEPLHAAVASLFEPAGQSTP